MNLLLLLPAYNEADSLTAMKPELERLAEMAGHRGIDFGLIVVDDGSTDGTAKAAARLPNARIIRHAENRGLAEALRTLMLAFLSTSEPSDVCVVMDADNTMDPTVAVNLVEALIAHQADVAIASRFARGGTQSGVPGHRTLLSLGASITFRALARVPNVRDYTCGFRAYRNIVLRRLHTKHNRFFDAAGFSAGVELLLRLDRLGARVVEVPFHLKYDQKVGASKIRIGRTLKEYGRLLIAVVRGFSWLPGS